MLWSTHLVTKRSSFHQYHRNFPTSFTESWHPPTSHAKYWVLVATRSGIAHNLTLLNIQLKEPLISERINQVCLPVKSTHTWRESSNIICMKKPTGIKLIHCMKGPTQRILVDTEGGLWLNGTKQVTAPNLFHTSALTVTPREPLSKSHLNESTSIPTPQQSLRLKMWRNVEGLVNGNSYLPPPSIVYPATQHTP